MTEPTDSGAIEAVARAMFDVYEGYDAETKQRMWHMQAHTLRHKAKRILSTLKSLGFERVKDGWQVVPREPTDAMIARALFVEQRSPTVLTDTWRTMLSASPRHKDGE